METAEQAPTRLSIDVWSDIVCPFTVLGERLGIPGAVETGQFLAAIDQAWEQVNG